MGNIDLIKQLRNMTQAGFQDCKIAIEKFNGNLDEAVKYLREKGLAKAAKKAGAIAAEGAILVKLSNNKATMIEMNSQTDFAAKNENFITLSEEIINVLSNSNVNNIDDANNVKLSSNETIISACNALTGKIGEKISIRRIENVQANPNQDLAIYQHANKKYGAIVLFDQKIDENLKKQIAMHIVARNPRFINRDQVDKKWLENEKAIITSTSNDGKKPLQFLEKIINGRLQKKLSEVCLYDQEFDFDSSTTVGKLLHVKQVNVLKFVRYEVGEGIEITKKNFADEVAEQME